MKKNYFIEDTKSSRNWEDNAIYGIGIYDPNESKTEVWYVGEADNYSNRELTYPPEVTDRMLDSKHVARVPHLYFRGKNVEKKLKSLGDLNPFETTDLKRFRRIIERVLIDIFDTPKECNKQRSKFKSFELSAGYILYLLSRKYLSIPECLEIMKCIDPYEFNYIEKRFDEILPTDTKEVSELKEDINKMSVEILDFIQRGKFLQQGGYYKEDVSNIVFENDNAKIFIGDNYRSQDSSWTFCEDLWNAGIGGSCICIYKDNLGKYQIILDPSDKGLGVDIYPWFDQWKEKIGIDDSIVYLIKETLLFPSEM